jgi:hypothetical protein
LQEGFQTPSHQERTKDTKKDYFFLRELSVYLVFAERRIPAYWRDLGVEQFICSYAALGYNMTGGIFVFWARNSKGATAEFAEKAEKI